MRVAKRYIENKPQEIQNKRVILALNKQKINLITCSLTLGFCVLSLILSVCFGTFNLTKPNIMASNILFYVLFFLYALASICFIYYNYKQFDFNIVFGYVASELMLSATFVSIFLINNIVCTFVFGTILMYFSMLTNFCICDKIKKASNQFSLAHLFHFYIFITAVLLMLVN